MNAHRLIASLAIFAVVVGGIGVTIAVLTGNKTPPPAASQPPPTPGRFAAANAHSGRVPDRVWS